MSRSRQNTVRYWPCHLHALPASTLPHDVHCFRGADLVTSIQRASYYGRDVETAAENGGKGGGGLIVIRTVTTLLAVTYAFPVVAAEAVPLAECFADKLIEHGL